jgi:predicted peroxiredoxin/TusA-related sulfurtransferase
MAPVSSRRRLELRGKTITTFIAYEAAVALGEMGAGDELELITDDQEAIRCDLEAWCRAVGHGVVSVESDGAAAVHFVIENGAPRERKRTAAFVISDPGLEQLVSPLGFALAAALEGDDVHIYFQGPAVRLLTKGYQPRLSGLARPFSGVARKGMAKQGHLPPHEKLRQLRALGARFYLCGGSMDHFNVKRSDLAFDDLPVIQYLTFVEVMDEAQVHVFLQ